VPGGLAERVGKSASAREKIYPMRRVKNVVFSRKHCKLRLMGYLYVQLYLPPGEFSNLLIMRHLESKS
jgi:hypothetical protein